MCAHNLCLGKNKKKIKIFQLKILNFYNLGKICISHGHVFVMPNLRFKQLKVLTEV